MADFCPYCGKQLTEEGVMFCPFCGKSMKEEEPVQSAQNSQSAFQQAPPETEEAYEQIFSDKESAERYYDSLNDRYGSGERETSNREYFRPNSWDRGVFRSNALGKPKNKWVSLALLVCTVFGHKFYEEKIGMGILYIFTGGLFGIGWLIDLIKIATGPETYYVQ